MDSREKALALLTSGMLAREGAGATVEVLGHAMQTMLPAVGMGRGRSFKAAGLAAVVKGIVDLCTDTCTIEAGIVEDMCQMVERCQDREELRDLSVQVRDLMFRFEPDASRVAMTEDEARVLHLLQAATG